MLSSEPSDPFGVTRIKFHYFDERGELDETRSFPHLLLSPVVANMTDDGRADVLFSDSRVGMLLGRADRSWVPETFSSYRLPDTAIRTLTLRDALVEEIAGFVVFADLDDGPGIYVAQGFPRLLGALPGPIERARGRPGGGPGDRGHSVQTGAPGGARCDPVFDDRCLRVEPRWQHRVAPRGRDLTSLHSIHPSRSRTARRWWT